MGISRILECLCSLLISHSDEFIAYEVVDVSGLVVSFFRLGICSRQLDELLAVSIVFSEVLLGKRVDNALLVNLASEHALDISIERNTEFISSALKPVDIDIGSPFRSGNPETLHRRIRSPSSGNPGLLHI